MTNYFISADWGTTHLRLRLVETASLIIEAQTEGLGIRQVNERFHRQDAKDRQTFFTRYLLRCARALPNRRRADLIVVSGMASANIGLLELPYGWLPLMADGVGIVSEHVAGTDGLPDLLLISGMRSDDDVMRGEETQALGLLSELPGAGTLLLPGTHSKHLGYRDGHIESLRTFMTGELFALLGAHSLLASAVARSDRQERFRKHFLLGIERGATQGATVHLFGLRSGQLLHGRDPQAQYFYLSGLLVGDELRHLPAGVPVCLAADGELLTLYQCALRELLPAAALTVFDGRALVRAFLRGQRTLALAHGE